MVDNEDGRQDGDAAPNWGEYERCVDEKGRFTMPVELRDVTGPRFVLARAPDSAIALVPADRWEGIRQRLEESLAREGIRSPYRVLSSHAEVTLDGQGRVQVPRFLREWAGIETGETVVVVGVGPTIEVWSKCRWTEFLTAFTRENVRAAARSVGLEGLLD